MTTTPVLDTDPLPDVAPTPVRDLDEHKRPRLRSIDTVRGAVLALMLFTPPLGTHWPWLHHAAWNGLTVSDMVLPIFLATSGASLAFLLKPPFTAATARRLVKRTIALVVLGVLYNAYGTVGADFAHVRFTGVLQLIGLGGALTAIVVLVARWLCRGRDLVLLLAVVAAGITLTHGILLETRDGRCDGRPDCSPLNGANEAIVGEAHSYREGAVDYDPEGVAVILASPGLLLAGYCAGLLLRERRPPSLRTVALPLAGAGVALLALAALLDGSIPVNKRIFSPSFVLVMSGIFLLLVTAFALLLDTRVEGRGANVTERLRAVASHPFRVLGANAIVVYLVERFLTQTAANTEVKADSTRLLLQDWVFAHWLPGSAAAQELWYGVLLLAILLAVTYVMHALKWRIAL